MRWIVSDLVLREEREEEKKKRKMTLRILVERRSMWSRVSFSTHRRLEISCRLTVWSLLRFLYVFTCDYVLGISAPRHPSPTFDSVGSPDCYFRISAGTFSKSAAPNAWASLLSI